MSPNDLCIRSSLRFFNCGVSSAALRSVGKWEWGSVDEMMFVDVSRTVWSSNVGGGGLHETGILPIFSIVVTVGSPVRLGVLMIFRTSSVRRYSIRKVWIGELIGLITVSVQARPSCLLSVRGISFLSDICLRR